MSSRFRSNVPIGLAAIAGLLVAAEPGGAQVQDQKLRVEAFVGDVCTVETASLNFGEYIGGSGLEKSGTIQIQCVTETDLQVALNGGLGTNNGGGLRSMKNGGSQLHYILHQDASRSNPWEVNEAVPASTDPNGAAQVTVFGLIPGVGQPPLVNGSYSDDVTITLSF
jgi:spore coat protein U-like protein